MMLSGSLSICKNLELTSTDAHWLGIWWYQVKRSIRSSRQGKLTFNSADRLAWYISSAILKSLCIVRTSSSWHKPICICCQVGYDHRFDRMITEFRWSPTVYTFHERPHFAGHQKFMIFGIFITSFTKFFEILTEFQLILTKFTRKSNKFRLDSCLPSDSKLQKVWTET